MWFDICWLHSIASDTKFIAENIVIHASIIRDIGCNNIGGFGYDKLEYILTQVSQSYYHNASCLLTTTCILSFVLVPL